MSLHEQIKSAIGAHGLWKVRLKQAIDSGGNGLSVNVVRDDHKCAFGTWLHGSNFQPGVTQSENYRSCVELHRRFHCAAADVLSLVIAGKKQDATAALGARGEFSRISAELTNAMMSWLSEAQS